MAWPRALWCWAARSWGSEWPCFHSRVVKSVVVQWQVLWQVLLCRPCRFPACCLMHCCAPVHGNFADAHSSALYLYRRYLDEKVVQYVGGSLFLVREGGWT